MVAKSNSHHRSGTQRNDNSPVLTNAQWFPRVSKWCRISSIHSRCVLDQHVFLRSRGQGFDGKPPQEVQHQAKPSVFWSSCMVLYAICPVWCFLGGGGGGEGGLETNMSFLWRLEYVIGLLGDFPDAMADLRPLFAHLYFIVHLGDISGAPDVQQTGGLATLCPTCG